MRLQEFRKRHHVETFKNETQLISTMILKNATNEDTGYYSCQGTSEKSDRYIYVTSNSLRNAVLKKGNMNMLWKYSKFYVFKTETQSLKNGVNFFFSFLPSRHFWH